MDRAEILNIKPGNALNALIAEKIFGCQIARLVENDARIARPFVCDDAGTVDFDFLEIEPYSTDACYALAVIEELKIEYWSQIFTGRTTYCVNVGEYITGKTSSVEADNVPEAICKAVLMAVLEVD